MKWRAAGNLGVVLYRRSMYVNKEGGIFMRQLTYFTLPNNGKPGLAFRALLPTIFLRSL